MNEGTEHTTVTGLGEEFERAVASVTGTAAGTGLGVTTMRARGGVDFALLGHLQSGLVEAFVSLVQAGRRIAGPREGWTPGQ